MKKHLKIYAFLFVATLLFAACKSGSTITTTDSASKLKGDELLEAVIRNTPSFESFTSRLKMNMLSGKSSMSLNGYLKMQRDELIQISLLIPILRSEAVRIEITPQSILVIDRLNKRYAEVPTEEIDQLLGAEVDFQTLQSLFSNSFFIPGKESFRKRDFNSFKAIPMGEDEVLLSRKGKLIDYSFVASRITNRLTASKAVIPSSGQQMQWYYNKFVEVGDTTFPSDITIVVQDAKKSSNTNMELSKLTINKEKIIPTPPPTKYQPVTLGDILKSLRK